MGVFMMAKVYGVIIGDTSKPNEDTRPSAPAKPIVINNQTPVVDIPKLQAMWMQYQVEMMGYSHLVGEYNHKLSNWTDANSQAMGILNRALDIGIWDQIKEKTAKESWEWLKTKYAKQSHLEVLEHFCFMKDQRFDLSDPNPQLAIFMHHFQALPDKFVSPAMACLILLSNLPLTTNPGQESVYQHMLENIFAGWTPESLTPDEVTTQIRDVWGARFGGFHPSQQPHRGATYDKGKAPANKPQQKQQTQVQRNTAIKGKGPNPQYSEQQSTDSSSSQQKKKRPFQHGGKGRGAHSHVAGAPDTTWPWHCLRENMGRFYNPSDGYNFPPITGILYARHRDPSFIHGTTPQRQHANQGR